MAKNTSPNLRTSTTVISAQALLATTGHVRGQLDLSLKYGAVLTVDIARISITAYTNPIDIVIHGIKSPFTGTIPNILGTRSINARFCRQSTLTASTAVTAQVNTANAAGDSTISIKTSNLGGAYNNLIAFLGQTAPGSLTNAADLSATFEVTRVNKYSGAGPYTFTLANPLSLVHAQNDYVTNAAESIDIALPGGFVYDILIDANNISAGAGAVVRATASIDGGDNIA